MSKFNEYLEMAVRVKETAEANALTAAKALLNTDAIGGFEHVKIVKGSTNEKAIVKLEIDANENYKKEITNAVHSIDKSFANKLDFDVTYHRKGTEYDVTIEITVK